ncbi:E2/UBC family protein B [Paraburkholderia sp. BL6665CI2N2]|uniref:ThiF family adenylyltransferase n=1 Tax=Paraburkholderia sp. BL6665CI2N2 TaxID=1938806 RepID=UPI0010D0866A|nr:ThiF family adenylyltransferase [Paraburkholderia sp. BL6665CI2N2]TDY21970.1 E2/UBC family protein B [Paraburkholderia sp. BL6665CI2N2]
MQVEEYSSEVYGEIVKIIRRYGLRPARARGNIRAFEGPIATVRGDVPIRLEISDWDFEKYPRAYLLDKFPDGHRIYAHVDALGGLCYFTPESVVLDRYRPSIAVHQCLHAIESVLNKALNDDEEASADVENEFVAYWSFGQLPPAKSVIIDDLPPQASEASYFSFDGPDEDHHAVICEDSEHARRLISALGYSRTTELAYTCLLFASEQIPAAPAGAFPGTIHELFTWIGTWDRPLLRSIRARLASHKEYLAQERCVLAFSTPSGRFGAEFRHDRVHRLGLRRNPAEYCNFLHGKKGRKTAIVRLRLDEIGAPYIHSRNLEFESLAGKRIKLIGCGAIGGYLAAALVRLGAGTGKGGRLFLCDPGTLEPDNLGRHTLGFRALFRNKAEALRTELVSQFPYLDIVASGEQRPYTDEFFATDLVIDATGNEAHNEKLNFYHLKRRLCPVLYVRIRGNGECVQTLLSDSPQHACFRCLRQGEGGNYLEERFPVLKSAPVTRFRGCASFTPYAVSSSLSAAALATDVVIDWLKGNPAPRFRTRHIENANTRRLSNQDLPPIKRCPACQTSS